jgi:hypothetical protein
MFYTDMLQHLNFRRLSPRAVKLLMNVSASYSGFNNGDLAVTLTVMEPFGWKGNDQLRKALSELMHYGFLVKTRQGGRNLCSLYALGWHAIDHCKGKHDATETRTPPDFWRKQFEPFDPSKHLGRGPVFGTAKRRT